MRYRSCFHEPITMPYRTHAYNKWEFLFVTKGSVVCMIGGKRYAVQKNL